MIRNKWGQFAHVVELPASNRGRNKRGLCAHKASRPPKRPKPYIISGQPQPLRASRINRLA